MDVDESFRGNRWKFLYPLPRKVASTSTEAPICSQKVYLLSSAYMDAQRPSTSTGEDSSYFSIYFHLLPWKLLLISMEDSRYFSIYFHLLPWKLPLISMEDSRYFSIYYNLRPWKLPLISMEDVDLLPAYLELQQLPWK